MVISLQSFHLLQDFQFIAAFPLLELENLALFVKFPGTVKRKKSKI